MRRASVVAAAVAALVGVGASAACNVIVKDPLAALGKIDTGAGESLSREAALADLDFLVGLIDRVHPDPYRFHPREMLDAERRRAAETMPATLTRSDLCVRLSRVVAVIEDGHTSIACDDLTLGEWRRASDATPAEAQRVLRFAPFVRLDDQEHPIVSWHNGARGLTQSGEAGHCRPHDRRRHATGVRPRARAGEGLPTEIDSITPNGEPQNLLI